MCNERGEGERNALMSIVIVTAQNKGRRREGKEDRKKKKSQVPPLPLFEYEPALTAKVKKPVHSICTKDYVLTYLLHLPSSLESE